jgi:AcrR family transcriptional regulator
VVNEVGGHRHGRVPKAVREQQLVDVAERLFAARGHHGTSIEEIVRAAGVSRPIFYDHFTSKDDVYLACLRRARRELDACIAAAVDQHDQPSDQLASGIRAYFEFVDRHAASWDVLFGRGAAVAGPIAEEADRLRFHTVGGIAALLRRAVPALDGRAAEAFAHALSGSGELLAKWWRTNPDLTCEEISSYHMAFAWHGLERLINSKKT